IDHLYPIDQNKGLLGSPAIDRNIGLCTKRPTLANVHSTDIGQYFVQRFGRQGFYLLLCNYLNVPCRLIKRHLDSVSLNDNFFQFIIIKPGKTVSFLTKSRKSSEQPKSNYNFFH